MVKSFSLHAFLCLLLCLGLCSCSEDFKMEKDYKSVTVIYGLLNQDDPVQYIRIQRTYMGGGGSAYIGALIPDSNYNENIVVVMKEFSREKKLLTTTLLSKVDLNKEGLVKKPGLFFSDYNYAYKYERRPDSTRLYRIIVTNTETGTIDSAETDIVNAQRFFPTNYKFPSNLPGVLNMKLSDIGAPESMNYAAFSKSPESGICWAVLDIYYEETNLNTGEHVVKSLLHYMPFYIPYNVPVYSWQNPAKAFYYFLGTNIAATGPEIERRLLYCNMSVYAGGKELARYIDFVNTSTLGLAGTSMGISTYSNVKSTAGRALGVFSSQVSKYYEHNGISYRIDSLQTNKYTKHLNFKR